MTSLHSSPPSTVTPQSSDVRGESERTVTLDAPTPHRGDHDPAAPKHAAARRGSPDPLHGTDRYRLTVPFVDRIR